ncbi:hypothetical protein [Mycoplasmopsis pullorum]|nr:hypothetical protein [Mycoplasmopsis pullorum]
MKKYYEINGEIQGISIDLLVDSLRMMTITRKNLMVKLFKK